MKLIGIDVSNAERNIIFLICYKKNLHHAIKENIK